MIPERRCLGGGLLSCLVCCVLVCLSPGDVIGGLVRFLVLRLLLIMVVLLLVAPYSAASLGGEFIGICFCGGGCAGVASSSAAGSCQPSVQPH